MLQTTQTTIRGIRIMTEQLRPMRSFSLMPKLLKIVGPALAPLVTGEISVEQDIEVLFPVLVSALERLDADDAEQLLGRILESTVVVREGNKYELTNEDQINAAFTGDLKAMLEATWFVLKANYESFFDADLLKTAAVSQEAEKASLSS